MVLQAGGEGGGRTVHFSSSQQMVVREELLPCDVRVKCVCVCVYVCV